MSVDCKVERDACNGKREVIKEKARWVLQYQMNSRTEIRTQDT